MLNASRIRVLCVDDHRVMLDGLSLLLGREPDMEVVASATSGEEAVELFARHGPDVTLMDLQLGDDERPRRDPSNPQPLVRCPHRRADDVSG